MENMMSPPAPWHRASVSSADTGGLHDGKMQMKSQSLRRQSAPPRLTKALTRSRTVSSDSFQVPVCPETCPLIRSYLACPGRAFLLQGPAQLKTGLQTQERHLFLFSDTLLVTKAKAVNNFKQKVQVRLCEMWAGGSVEEVCEGSTPPGQGFVMGWPTCNCVATFSSSEQTEKWLSLLKSRIKEEKEREEPKTIALSVHGKGINATAHTKTLAVTNADSTNEVVRLALQQFGIAGHVKDYQLWVLSKRDSTPYPLIGHEFPFSVHAHHARKPPSRDVLASSDRQGAPPEQAPGGKRCQFILKPRPVAAAGRAPVDTPQKHFKRQRSLIHWAFWRGSTPQLSNPASSGHRGNGCLFGQPLSSLCLEDALPKPITDMLFFLYHEGSWTRGIFRRSAGARAVRELRDSLDAGWGDLPLTRDHVFIIAGVFKDFLRNIPGSLLCSELYEEWAEVVEEEEEKEEGEQVQDIQRLIGRLPVANVALLHHVVALLHGIHGNASHNQMTSFNLSVCIAPSMLWAPGPSSPEREGRGAKTVCDLVRFMIDHCPQVLGQEPCSLFGGPPLRRGDVEPPSESWSGPLTDSSDSLENELDDASSGGSSPTLTRRRRRRRNHGDPLRDSLDSVLTLSDADPDDGGGDAATTAPPPLSAGNGGAAAAGREDPRSPGGGRRRRSEPAIAYGGGAAAGSGEAASSSWSLAPSPRSPLETLLDRAARPLALGPRLDSRLKEAQRLSQQENPEKEKNEEEEEERVWKGSRPRGPHHRGDGGGPGPEKDGDLAAPSPRRLAFYRRPGATTLSLFRGRRSGQAAVATVTPPETSAPPPHQRVESAAAAAARRQRRGPTADPESRGPSEEARTRSPSLSPAASVEAAAPALVRGRAQWRRRRRHGSAAAAERDFNRLLCSEESYV